MKHLPNILTVLRLCLIPLFLVVFFKFSTVVALGIFILAGITDVLDGTLARRFGWGSTFGKVVDPIADKLMQGAMLVALVGTGLLPVYFAIPLVVKELSQGVLSVLMLKRRAVVTVSFWYGKFAITVFYIAAGLTVLFSRTAWTGAFLLVNVLWGITLAVMLYAFVNYVVCYARLAVRLKQTKKGVAPGGEL